MATQICNGDDAQPYQGRIFTVITKQSDRDTHLRGLLVCPADVRTQAEAIQRLDAIFRACSGYDDWNYGDFFAVAKKDGFEKIVPAYWREEEVARAQEDE